MSSAQNAGCGVAAKSCNIAAPSFGLKPAALKMLLPADEVACILLAPNNALRNVQTSTGTIFNLSGDKVYPGSDLQEISVRAGSCEAVFSAVCSVLTLVSRARGRIGSSFPEQSSSEVRLHLVVPAIGAKQIIGVQGAAIDRLRMETSMKVFVDNNMVPPGKPIGMSEQVLYMEGPLSGLRWAIKTIVEHLVASAAEPWFSTWATTSNSGLVIPGFVLFDPQGKGNGKGKFKDNSNSVVSTAVSLAAPPPVPSAPPGPPRGPNWMCVKILLSKSEASAVLGKGGDRIRAIEMLTGTAMQMSQKDQFFPGTSLQELRICGATEDLVLAGAQYALGQVTAQLGVLASSEDNVEKTEARLRLVVPTIVAMVLNNEENMSQLRAQTRMHSHIDPTLVPPGVPPQQTEQVLCFSGPLDGVVPALQATSAYIAQFVGELWFEQWSTVSNCGVDLMGFVLPLDREQLAAKALAKVRSLLLESSTAGPLDPRHVAAQVAQVQASLLDVSSGSNPTPAPAEQAAQDINLQYAVALQAAAHQAMVSKAVGTNIVPVSTSNSGDGLLVGVKLLISDNEAHCLLSQNGTILVEIQALTNTNVRMGDGHYPGTTLNELTISGVSREAVHLAMVHVLSVIIELLGMMASGEGPCDKGCVRMKMVLPAKAAASVIGVGGNSVKQICTMCNVRIEVDHNPVPAGCGATEQALMLCGTAQNAQSALPHILDHVHLIASEKDIGSWAAHTNAGTKIPGLRLFSENPGPGVRGTKRSRFN